ncbi:hypothetical protein Back11_12020 [Paenibacillus baekrokdamisoli]|uniref:Uncharacterized protein n=1 Tax=Paenibacillus baekrokdamisoli TaxID=1712516 RepID=A0A3G9ILN1_9BACL|nr:hypothetical protein [Paenibacillus baekrokdamisoli]MBB3070507.1 hypothetical protein [Paenibacillus baekrokdamisoli]BBH19857.1 hypothetical protein Back11_12020 [Paenibacillus baekrokdamisoli]
MSKKTKGEQTPLSLETNADLFTKEQVVGSKSYEAQRDVLTALLDNNKLYTHDQITEMLHAFLNKEAK